MTTPAAPARGDATDPDGPAWRRPAPDRDGLRADALLAAGLLVGGLLSFVLWQVAGMYEDPAPGWASALCLAGVTLPLAVRRRWPSAVAVVVGAVFVVLVSIHVPETLVANIALFMGLYSVGAWETDRRRATWVRGAVIAGMFVWLLISLFLATNDPDSLPDLSRAGAFSPLVAYLLIQLLTNVAYFAAAYWFGDHAWAAARQRARTARRSAELDRERRRVAEQAVTLERLRLARELHDAVAHHVSLMGVQAAAARTLLDSAPERAAGALELVEDAAREAVSELHGVLGTLRDPGAGAGASAGAGPGDPVGSLGVGRLPELVADARAAGLRTSFEVVGDAVPLSPIVSLNLYRIAQEALTNTRKHAGPHASADVRLRYLPDAVELEVSDDGHGSRRVPMAGSGLGLLGMRERVGADGGTLEVGPRSRGGFLVRARVPLGPRGAAAEPQAAGAAR